MPEKIGFSAALKRVAPGFGILWIIERRLTAGGGRCFNHSQNLFLIQYSPGTFL
jgi:hypothetical protein